MAKPIIYKPSIYNGPTLYKGDGSVYNGNGVYNDGTGLFVEIGGKKYPVVKIGSQLWTAKNLDLETTNFYYPDNDVQNKKYGLLYPYISVLNDIIPILPDGWRIPTRNDFLDLISLNNNPLQWITEEFGGNDKLGFSAPLIGFRNYYGVYLDFTTGAFFWTSTFYGTFIDGGITYNRNYNLELRLAALNCDDYTAATPINTSSISLRLVKDV